MVCEQDLEVLVSSYLIRDLHPEVKTGSVSWGVEVQWSLGPDLSPLCASIDQRQLPAWAAVGHHLQAQMVEYNYGVNGKT